MWLKLGGAILWWGWLEIAFSAPSKYAIKFVAEECKFKSSCKAKIQGIQQKAKNRLIIQEMGTDFLKEYTVCYV